MRLRSSVSAGVLAGVVTASTVLPAASAGAAEPKTPPVVRRGTTWHVAADVGSSRVAARFDYGAPHDLLVTGDWDGDGEATPGVYRNGTWYLRNSNRGGAAEISFDYGGRAGDLPVVGDWDGDGVDTPGIVRDGEWHLVNRHRGGAADVTFTFGRVTRGDVPVVGDWDGDGIDTPGVVRGSVWYLRNELAGGDADVTFQYGDARRGDVPVAGDWNGDGRDTAGIVRGNVWLLKERLGGGTADVAMTFGDPADQKTVRGGSADHGSVWYRLADCESDQRWHYNGRFDGGLQFHPTTWRAYRFAGYPSYAFQASAREQIAVAREVRREQGWGAWPACSRELGLR